MDDTAVRAQGLSKEFKLPHEKQTTIKGLFVNLLRGRRTYERQKVLKNISFEIKQGDFFGIVGRNGSGKSTLLKILAGVYEPTAGQIAINGKLTPFIELGVGFNPDLTGRENVFLNGALLGFTRKQMKAMYQEIVDFAGLERFMDQKLKNYSSGMQVRLAFSIAIKARNEILIFDEVLAVGDEAFQRKCLDIFEQYKAEKQTVILVTHDMETVKRFCTKAMLVHDGKIAGFGDPQQIADQYSQLNQQTIDETVMLENAAGRSGTIKTQLYSSRKQPKVSFDTGEQALLKISWKPNPAVASMVVDVFKKSGEHVTGFKSEKDDFTIKANATEAWIKLKLDLAPGKYRLIVSTRTKDDREVETLYIGTEFTMIKNWELAKQAWSGLMPIDHTWSDRP